MRLSSVRYCWVLLFLIPWLLQGQTSQLNNPNIKVRGQFLIDSIKIGQVFPYVLSAEYPAEENILFPDSTFGFTPFEYSGKRFFSTQTKNGISRDSVIYYLNSFEIDSVQSLRLPVFVVQPMDCTEVWTNVDQVWLKHLVTIATDSVEATKLPLKINSFYEPVAWLLDYPLIAIIGGIVLVALIISWVIFGKRIRRYFKVRSMRKSFNQYTQTFSNSIEQLKSNYSASTAEHVVGIWKKYLESLENKPFTKYTSKEILRTSGNEALAEPLRTVDRLIYAGVEPSSFDAFYELKSYSEDCFYKKLEEVNGPVK
jgi:hypothetical protein